MKSLRIGLNLKRDDPTKTEILSKCLFWFFVRTIQLPYSFYVKSQTRDSTEFMFNLKHKTAPMQKAREQTTKLQGGSALSSVLPMSPANYLMCYSVAFG